LADSRRLRIPDHRIHGGPVAHDLDGSLRRHKAPAPRGRNIDFSDRRRRLGLWIGPSARFDWPFSPIRGHAGSALAALIPILVLVYGIGLTSKVFVVCIMAMPVIVLNTATAVRNTPASIKEMAKSYMARDHDVLLKIILPAASPMIFSGLRLGVSAGFIGAILAELKITPTGVGDIITYSRSIADYPSMYAAIFSIILLAVLFLNLLEKFESVV
jgi:NitT/TauT family transport system permease protein